MINDFARQVEQVLQFGQTKRYHTEMVLKEQDVAQHSFNVAWLCYMLTDRCASGALIMAALAHDAGERKTGDMPAPIKRAVKASQALDDLESDHLFESCGFMPMPLTPDEHTILKVADSLDGAFYCLRELKMGNRLVVDSACGGAARNFMTYVRERRAVVPDSEVRRKVAQLYDFLERGFDEFSK